MSDLLAELRSKWHEAAASGAGDRIWRAVALSISAPVRLLAGVRERDARISILIETPIRNAPKHRVRFQAEGISLVDERWIDEGLLRLAVSLERSDLQEVFEILAMDLINVARNTATSETSVSRIIGRLEAWQACLRIRQRGLSREEQVGLRGELAVLELAGRQIGLSSAISCWCGPLDGIHDFQARGVAVEVKTSLGIAHHIRISRLDQLDTTGISMLVLARVQLQEAPAGASLPESVALLREAVTHECPNSTPEFEDKLLRAGYLDADGELYVVMKTMVYELHAYRVNEQFPRLTGDTVPTAIADATYSLDERLLVQYRLGDEEFEAEVRRLGGVNE